MSKVVNLNVYFPEEEIDNQWIIDLIGCIKFSAQKVLEPDCKCNIFSVDLKSFSRTVIKPNDYHILILGSENNDSKQFQEGLNNICSSVLTEDNTNITLTRIFKILLKPEDQFQQPECLKPFIGYEFFSLSPRGNAINIFEISYHETHIWGKVLDVIYDLKQVINSLSGISDSEPEFTYLLNCSSDQKLNYDDIKRELQHFNLTVLPLLTLPEDENGKRESIERDLKECKLIIQIIGGKYGQIKKGNRVSEYELENNIVTEYLSQNPHKYRLIWKASDLKVTEPRQNLFLSRLLKDGVDKNSRIVESGIEEFKDIIAQFISNRTEGYTQLQDKSVVYLMSGNQDSNSKLDELCIKLNLNLIKEKEIEGENFYLNHLEQLKTANSLLIEYTDDSKSWLFSKLGDIIKVIGIGRNVPLNAVGIIGKNIPPIEEYQKWLPGIKIINIDDMNSLEKHLTNTFREK